MSVTCSLLIETISSSRSLLAKRKTTSIAERIGSEILRQSRGQVFYVPTTAPRSSYTKIGSITSKFSTLPPGKTLRSSKPRSSTKSRNTLIKRKIPIKSLRTNRSLYRFTSLPKLTGSNPRRPLNTPKFPISPERMTPNNLVILTE